MGKIVLDVSISLDGFTAGPNVREAEPMGGGGERLHAWMAATGPEGEIDAAVRREVDAAVGATVIGRRTFNLGLHPWERYAMARCSQLCCCAPPEAGSRRQ